MREWIRGAISDASAVVLLASTYRASYPGVLKNLLDLLPVPALRSKPVGIVALGATDHHFLGVDSQQREVLAWFGARVAPISVYLSNRDFNDQEQPSEPPAEKLRELGATMMARPIPGGVGVARSRAARCGGRACQ